MSRRRARRAPTPPLTYSQVWRDPTPIASALPDLYHPTVSAGYIPSDLRQVEDRRRFTPSPIGGQRYRPAKTLRGSPARFKVGQATHPPTLPRFARLSPVVAFQAPSRVVICVRRKRRKEVLHALGLAGRGPRRAPRRNAYSHISCR